MPKYSHTVTPEMLRKIREREAETYQPNSFPNQQVPHVEKAMKPYAEVEAVQLKVATDATTPKARRVQMLHRVGHQFSSAVTPHAACRKGCAHCCFIPVLVSSMEADVIGEAIGVRPATPALVDELPAEAYGLKQPCTFLNEDEKCSIYEHRPMACRLLLNLDKDDLLCHLVGRDYPGEPTPSVPYVDTSRYYMAYVQAVRQTGLADLRDFFPNGLKDSRRGKGA